MNVFWSVLVTFDIRKECMIKKLLVLLPLLPAAFSITSAQNNTTNDTANYPYWIEMMRMPDANYYKVKRAFDLYWKDSVPERGFGYKVFKRWEWRVRDRMLPDGSIVWGTGPLQELGAANAGGLNNGNYTQGISGGGVVTPAAPCPGSGRWTPVGPVRHPYNQSGQPTGIGRINGIAFHPSDTNVLFAMAPQGGVWRSTNHGQTWKHIFGNGPVVNTIGVSCMVLSYNNPDTMYIGTGDRDAGDAPGFGVLWSTDGGNTWAVRNSGMGNRIVGKIVMHAKNSRILIAATNGGIYRSTNSGLSWTAVVSSGNFVDLVAHPYNPDILYATRNGLFFRSTDNGQTWTQITSGLPTSSSRGQIAVSKANRGYVYFVTSPGANFQGLYRSTDSGSTFSSRSTTPNILGYYDGTSGTGDLSNGQGWYDLDIAADPNNAEVIYVGGVNIWKSTNGGTNWTQTAHWYGGFGADDIHADQHAIELNPAGNKLYSGNDGGIYYSTNAGSRWINISSGIQNSQIYRLAHSRTDEFISAEGYQDNGSSQTTNDEFYTYYGGDGMDCQVDPTNASYVYGAYVYGRIYRSIDKNNNVTVGANGTGGINEGGNWLTPFVLQEGQPGTMFAGYSNVWRTTAVKTGNPPTWTRISTGFGGIRMLESSMAKNDMLYVLQNSGNMQRTSNATATTVAWTNLGTGPGGVRWIEAHHKDSNRVYCVNGSNLYRSTNKGATWTAISTPSGSGSLNMCIVDTSSATELIYIAAERGVYVWDSAANQTVNYNNGFPLWGDVTDLDIWYSPKGKTESKIVASTYGRGVWRSQLYDAGVLKPKSRLYAFDSVIAVGGIMRLYEKVGGTASSIRWKITPYTYIYTEGTDSLSYAPVIQFNKKGIYTVQLIAGNCQGNDTMTKKNWVKVFEKPLAPQCVNTTNFYTQSSALGLFKFTLAGKSSETGGYFDDGQNLDLSSNKVFVLKPSTTYTLTAKTGLYNGEYVRMYFDYNGDGKFQNYRGEVTTSSAQILGNRNLTFTTPAAPLMNKGLRFRIMSDFYALDTNACMNLSYGQGEDYSIVFDAPKPYFKADKLSACIGETIVFTDTTDGLSASWDWDFGVDATPRFVSGQGPHSVKYSSAGAKSVRLRINGTDSIRKNAYITINASPDPMTILKTGSNVGCEGRNITLAARNKNGVPFVVQWQKNGANLTGKTDTLLTFSSLLQADSGLYQAVLNNNGCKVTSSTVKITVYAKPKVSFTVDSGAQCLKNNSFNYTNTSSIAQGSSSYLWRLGDGNTQTTTHASRTYAAAGTYTVKLIANSNLGCKDSAQRNVTVHPRGMVRFSVNDTDQCLSGNSYVLSNNSSLSGGSHTYAWQFGDASGSSAVAPVKTYAAHGMYNILLIATTDKGCVDSFSKPVRVYSKPSVIYTVTTPNWQCFRNNKFDFNNTSSNPDGALTYLWNFGNAVTANTVNASVSYAAAGNYSVKLVATSAYGCKDSVSATMSVKPNPVTRFAVNDSDQCLSGNRFKFTNTSSVSSGSISSRTWDYGDGTKSSLPAADKVYNAFGTYTVSLVSVTDWGCTDTMKKPVRVYGQSNLSFVLNAKDQCLKGNNFAVTNSSSSSDGVISYLWDFGNGNSSTQSNPVFNYNNYGQYAVKLISTTSNACKDSLVSIVNVWPQAAVSFAVNDSNQCHKGNGFVFTNKSSIPVGSIAYSWKFGDGSSAFTENAGKTYSTFGKYTVSLITLTDRLCKDTANMPVRVYAMPVSSFTMNVPNDCLKDNLFVATDKGSIAEGNYTTQWHNGDGTVAATVNNTHSYANHGTYTVKQVLTSEFGCLDSTQTVLRVDPMPVSKFTASPTGLCENERVYFANNSSIVSGTLNHVWLFGNGNTKSGDTASVAYSGHGLYKIQLVSSSNFGCSDTAVYNMKVASNPVASFTALPNPACAQQSTVWFTNTSNNADGNALQSAWDFGDANVAITTNASHTYATHGLYKAVLKVNNGKCSDTASANITVVPKVSASFGTVIVDKETRKFTAFDTLTPGYAYNWYFGDSSERFGRIVQHMYKANDTFTVVLVVTNSIGCSDTSSAAVAIYSPNYKPQDNDLNFYVYPNPNTGKFAFKFELKEKGDVEVLMYDILGQGPLYKATWTQVDPGPYFETVDMKKLGLSPGTYPFIIQSGSNRMSVTIIYTGAE